MKDVNSSGSVSPELTRREWLLKLGEAAVLLGFTGSAVDCGAEAAAPAAPDATQLPPGLYEPLREHLGHALTLDAPFHPVPPDSETDYVTPRTSPFQPQFFAPEEFKAVSRMVELMLGEALPGKGSPNGVEGHEAEGHDTAGICQAVAEWIDLTVASSSAVREAARRLVPEHRLLAVAFYGAAEVEKLETWDPQTISREGLRWIEEESERQHGAGFLNLEEARQIGILRQISDRNTNQPAENAGRRFFDLIKSEVIRGFYTAQAGLKELGYKGNAFYAESPGCVRHQH